MGLVLYGRYASPFVRRVAVTLRPETLTGQLV
jgi:hypothetical protein